MKKKKAAKKDTKLKVRTEKVRDLHSKRLDDVTGGRWGDPPPPGCASSLTKC